jgi:hypothetical protein
MIESQGSPTNPSLAGDQLSGRSVLRVVIMGLWVCSSAEAVFGESPGFSSDEYPTA